MSDESLVNGLIQRGHYSKIREKGPFSIGTDFRPPAPLGHMIPPTELTETKLDEFAELMDRSERPPVALEDPEFDRKTFQDASARLQLQNGLIEAVKWYISDYFLQPEEKIVRLHLKKLEKAIRQFETELPWEHDAIGRFIHETYTGKGFLKDELKPSERDLFVLENAWRTQIGFIAVREHLKVMKVCVSAAVELLGKSKPRGIRKQAFVRRLAWTWKKVTGTWPKSSRDTDTHRQIGQFAQFVQKACELIPKPNRPKNLDAAIRKACEAGRQV